MGFQGIISSSQTYNKCGPGITKQFSQVSKMLEKEPNVEIVISSAGKIYGKTYTAGGQQFYLIIRIGNTTIKTSCESSKRKEMK